MRYGLTIHRWRHRSADSKFKEQCMKFPVNAVIIAVIVVLSSLTLAKAAFVVKLRNGNEFITGRYWREGSQVLFDVQGGIFGISDTFISAIEKTDRVATIHTVSESPSQQQSESLKFRGNSAASPKRTTVGNKEIISISDQSAKDEQVLKEFGDLQQRFAQLNDLATVDIHALASDIDRFRKRVMASALAGAHKDETDAASTLLRAIEGYVKATNR